jgi:hypothetical protein
MSADRPARHDELSYSTMLTKVLLVIREHSRKSAVRLFNEPRGNGSTAD